MGKKFDGPPPPETLNYPGPEHRILIVGRTGSGKSVAGLFHLSRSNFDEMPWTIVDSKRDAAFAQIQGLIEVDLDADPPRRPGLYVVRPTLADKERLENYLWKVHANGNHGLFIDEGYMVFRSKPPNYALQTIVTQGRTRRTPVIINSQRPTWLDNFAISEASFFQVFDLTDADDRKKIQRFIPKANADLMTEFGLHKSVYHDVGANKTRMLKPVRPPEESIALIDKRLDAIHKTTNTVKLRAI
jgi:hypothetical protein